MSESIDPSVSTEPSHSKGSQIETGLSLARVLSDARQARRMEEMLSRANPLDRPQIRANRRALQNLVASYLTRTGFEVDKIEAICEQLQAELRLLLEEQKAEAVKNSAHVSETLRHSADVIFEAFHQQHAGISRDILDEPFLIWQTQGIHFPEIQFEPRRSLAKFIFNAKPGTTGEEEMSFYFLWQNPSDGFAVINVDSALVLNGVCHAQTYGDSILPVYEFVSLKLGANLFLFEIPLTDPLEPKAADKKILESLFAQSEGFLVTAGGIDSTHVRTIAQLHHGPFLVAPHASTMFEVTVSMSFSAHNGSVSVDFAKGDFQVMCPGVAITILS